MPDHGVHDLHASPHRAHRADAAPGSLNGTTPAVCGQSTGLGTSSKVAGSGDRECDDDGDAVQHVVRPIEYPTALDSVSAASNPSNPRTACTMFSSVLELNSQITRLVSWPAANAVRGMKNPATPSTT